MSEYIHKNHNVTVLLYHLVLPAKYRRAVFDDRVDEALRKVCLEIGTDKDYVHFLAQSVPTYGVARIVTVLKNITTVQEIFRKCPHVKKTLWGGEFWTDGYFASTATRR